jgi:hypothetical protein
MLMDGRLEGVVDGCVLGWVWAPESPLERIWVTIFIDDAPVSVTSADLVRSDLLAAGIGDGAHGFEVELPVQLRDGEHEVRAMAGRSNMRLPHAAGTNGVAALAPDLDVLPGLDAATAGTRATFAWPSGWPERIGLRRWEPAQLLGVGLFGCVLALMLLSRHLGFYGDDWDFIKERDGWNAGAFLDPHNGHLMLIPIAIYKVLFVTAGVAHSWPYYLVLAAMHALCVLLLYILAARHAGRWAALIPAGLLLLPAAPEAVLWVASIGFVGSVTFALAALLCLERDDWRGDLAAMAALCGSLACTSAGVAIALGLLVMLASVRANRGRLWVVIAPLVFYGLWYLHYGSHNDQVAWANLVDIPRYGGELAASGFTGFGGLPHFVGWILLVAGVAWLVAHLARGGRLHPLTLMGLVSAIGFWALVTITRAQDAHPWSPRYLYVSMVFVLIGLIPYLHRLQVRSARTRVLLVAALALILLGNVHQMTKYVHFRTAYQNNEGLLLDARLIAHPPGGLLAEAAAPAVQEISLASEVHRRAVDNEIVTVDGPKFHAPSRRALAGATAPPVSEAQGLTTSPVAVSGASEDCVSLRPAVSGAFATVAIEPGHHLYVVLQPSGALSVWIRRFASTFSGKPLRTLTGADSPAVMLFRFDNSKRPWLLRLAPTAPTTVCQALTARTKKHAG